MADITVRSPSNAAEGTFDGHHLFAGILHIARYIVIKGEFGAAPAQVLRLGQWQRALPGTPRLRRKARIFGLWKRLFMFHIVRSFQGRERHPPAPFACSTIKNEESLSIAGFCGRAARGDCEICIKNRKGPEEAITMKITVFGCIPPRPDGCF
jgi:hypothetical protein